jgi:hypothetical protein
MTLFYRNIILGLGAIAVGLYGIRYYIGWPKFDAEKNKIREERVKKYGLLLLICSIGSISGGVSLLFLALKIN